MGDIREGVAAYQKAIKLAPDMKEAWINLAQVRQGLGFRVNKQRILIRLDLSELITL